MLANFWLIVIPRQLTVEIIHIFVSLANEQLTNNGLCNRSLLRILIRYAKSKNDVSTYHSSIMPFQILPFSNGGLQLPTMSAQTILIRIAIKLSSKKPRCKDVRFYSTQNILQDTQNLSLSASDTYSKHFSIQFPEKPLFIQYLKYPDVVCKKQPLPVCS